MARIRRRAREAALQLLYQVDITEEANLAAFELFWEGRSDSATRPEMREYADLIVRGVLAKREDLDQRIDEASAHWDLERMSRVDRNLLRIALWELTDSLEVPAEVVLDEALAIGTFCALRFGS